MSKADIGKMLARLAGGSYGGVFGTDLTAIEKIKCMYISMETMELFIKHGILKQIHQDFWCRVRQILLI